MRIRIALTLLATAVAGCSGGDFTGVFGKPEPEKAPVLHVFKGAFNPAATNVDKIESNVEILQIGLRAYEQPVTVTSIEFTFTGTALNRVTYAHLRRDSFGDGVINAGGGDTLISGILGPSSATLSFTGLSEVITPGSTEYWLLVFDIAAVAGDTFCASFAGGPAVSATCGSSALPLNLTAYAFAGNTMTAIDVGVLIAAVTAHNPANAQASGAENDLKVMHFTLSADATEKIIVREITFTDSGSGNLSCIEAVRLWIDADSDGAVTAGDSQVLPDNTFLIANRTTRWDLHASPLILNASQTLNFLLQYDFSSVLPPPLGSDYRASLASPASIEAIGQLSGYAINASGGFPISGGTVSIPIGSFSVTSGPVMPAGATVSPSTSQSMVQILIDAVSSTEDVVLSSMTFTDVGGGATVPPNMTAVQLFRDDGSTPGQFDPGPSGGDTIIANNLAYSGSNVHVTFAGGRQITKGTSETWILVYVFGAGAGGNYKAAINPATQIAAQGVQSGASITPSGSQVAGNLFVLAGTVPPPTAWGALSPGGTLPGPLMYHASVFDPTNSRIIFFGGTGSTAIAGGATSSSYALSTITLGSEFFSLLSPSGTAPSPRYAHAAAYDSGQQRMIVFGGYNNSVPNPGALFDVHALSIATPSGESWSQIWPSGVGPSSGLAHASAVYDRIGNRMILFGGKTSAGAVSQTTHFLSLGSAPQWMQVSISGAAPPARCGHVAVFDALSNSMLVFGGNDGAGNHMNDTWMLDLAGNAWNQIGTSTLPVARSEMGFGHDPNSRRFYIFGGDDGTGLARNDVYYFAYASSNWVSLSPIGIASARQGASGAFETTNNRLVFYAGGVIGGSGNTLHNDTLELR